MSHEYEENFRKALEGARTMVVNAVGLSRKSDSPALVKLSTNFAELLATDEVFVEISPQLDRNKLSLTMEKSNNVFPDSRIGISFSPDIPLGTTNIFIDNEKTVNNMFIELMSLCVVKHKELKAPFN